MTSGARVNEGETPVVLVVDDDPGLRALCTASLEPAFEVVEAASGAQGLRLLFRRRPDVILLDVSMPVMNGWETLRRIREVADTPVIMVTAAGEKKDIVHGLTSGADDYVVKPFSPAELKARILALLRRMRMETAAVPPVRPMRFDEGRLVVDPARGVAVVRGQEVALSATEYKLLSLLAKHAGQVLSHEQILAHVWGPAYAGEVGYIKTYIGLLRQKIEPDPHQPQYLRARRGLGYYLDPGGSEETQETPDLGGSSATSNSLDKG